MNFRIESELFGTLDIHVDIEDYNDDMWNDINDHLCVNIFVHPDDEEKELDDARYLANIWSLQRKWSNSYGNFLYTYGQELEYIDAKNITKKI